MLNVWLISFGIFILLVAARWLYGSQRSKQQREVNEILKQIDRDINSIDRKLLESGVRRASDSSRDSER